MTLKWTLPYILFGGTFVLPSASGALNNGDKDDGNFNLYEYALRIDSTQKAQERELKLKTEQRADSLCDAYMENMLAAQKNIKPFVGKHGYRAAVRRELPGAPVGQHCMYGQYTHLTRAQDEIGDTTTIIPDCARMACKEFKNQMRTKYANTPGCIREGVMFESDSAYNAALANYLAKRKINVNTPDSVRQTAIQQFATKNFSADSITPGSIVIVPRFRNSRNMFHAVMYLGRGHVKNGAFVPNANGQHMYAGHNRESIGDLFATYSTSNVFAADIKKIAALGYEQAHFGQKNLVAPPTKKAEPTVTHSTEAGRDVIYVFDNGKKVKRSGGTRAWRNQNPGNLRYTSLSRENGAIGKAGGFAVFPSVEKGRAALAELLQSDSYRNLTIARAIFVYAPPHENNTNAYKRQIQKMTGLNINTKISDLTPKQMESVIDAICVLEGWKTGRETQLAMLQKQTQRMA